TGILARILWPLALSPSTSSGQAARSEVEGPEKVLSLHLKRIPIERTQRASYLLYSQQHPRVIYDHVADLVHTYAFTHKPLSKSGKAFNWRWVQHLTQIGRQGTVLRSHRQHLGGNFSQR